MPVLALTSVGPSTTALDLISDALAEIGVLGAGQTAAPEDAAIGLRYLNRLVQRWSNSPLQVPVVTQVDVPLTGAQTYTIGPSGADVTADRPLTVVAARAVDSGDLRHPLDVLARNEWGMIANRGDGGAPGFVYYERAMPNGILHVYPTGSGYTVELDCLSIIERYELATVVSLPDGYESALVLSLAEDLCGPFGKRGEMELRGRAKGARAVVKRTNAEPLMQEQPLRAHTDFEIERGW